MPETTDSNGHALSFRPSEHNVHVLEVVIDVVVTVAVLSGQPHVNGQNAASIAEVHTISTASRSFAAGQVASSILPSPQLPAGVVVGVVVVVLDVVNAIHPQSTGQMSCPTSVAHVADASTASALLGQYTLSTRPSGQPA